ncbi:hypothetical protein YN1_8220 [Nanoarchaeota archaeon]
MIDDDHDFIKEFEDYWMSLIKKVTKNYVIIEDETQNVRTKIKVNGKADLFMLFWRSFIDGFSRNNLDIITEFAAPYLIKVLGMKREWKFKVGIGFGDLFLIDSDLFFYLIIIGENLYNSGYFDYRKLKEIKDKLSEDPKKDFYCCGMIDKVRKNNLMTFILY